MLRKKGRFLLLAILLVSPCAADALLAQGGLSFTRHDYEVGVLPYSVAVGDFNGDQIQDLAVANHTSASVSVLLGKGDGTFGPATEYGVGRGAISVAVGDFNGDEIPDLAVDNEHSDSVSILLGKGDGTFGLPQNFAVGEFPWALTLGDFNGDEIPDVATANLFSDNVSILLGNGNGTFRPAQNFPAGPWPTSVAVGDFNGDRKQDLAVANRGYLDPRMTVSVLLGNGNGTFQPAQSFGVSRGPQFVTAGDFNGDAKLDLVVANWGHEIFDPEREQYIYFPNTTVSVLLGRGDGTFAPPRDFAAGSGPSAIAVGDFNGDGILDLAVPNFGSDNISILLGNADGTFRSAQNFGVGRGSTSVAVGDFNGDELLDLIVANANSNSVSVLINNSQ